MTVGIYLLVFKGTDKVYVGQSINIEKRYREHIHSFIHEMASKKMQEAYNVYGTPSLEIICKCKVDELDQEEVSFINEFNSINDGFNYMLYPNSGGQGTGEDSYNSIYSNEECLNIMLYILSNPFKSNSIIAKELGYNTAVIGGISSGTRRAGTLKLLYPEEYASICKLQKTRGSYKVSPKDSLPYNKEAYLKVAQLLLDNVHTQDKISNITGVDVSVVRDINSCRRHKWISNVAPDTWKILLDRVTNKRNKLKP